MKYEEFRESLDRALGAIGQPPLRHWEGTLYYVQGLEPDAATAERVKTNRSNHQ